MKKLMTLTIIWLSIAACGPAPDQLPSGMQTQAPPLQDRLILSLPRQIWQDSYPELEGEVNIFTMNQDGTDLQLLLPGFDNFNMIVGISPDRNHLLISSFSNITGIDTLGTLYRANVDGSDSVKLTDGISAFSIPINPVALWLRGRNQIAYIAEKENGTHIFLTNPDGTGTYQIPDGQNQLPVNRPPLFFIGYSDPGELFWKTGSLGDATLLLTKSVWKINLDTNLLQEITVPVDEDLPDIYISPDDSKFISGGGLFDKELNLMFDTGLAESVVFWSPDGSNVILVSCEGENCINQNGEKILLVSDSNFISPTTLHIETEGVIMAADWHPSQNKVLLAAYEETNLGMELSTYVLSLDTMQIKPTIEDLEVVFPTISPFWFQDSITERELLSEK